MKELFRGLYLPDKQEFEQLWKHGAVIVDASVILNLYRLPNEARDQFLTLLEEMQDRLWLPHQAALEFQMNRINVIKSQIELFSSKREKISNLLNEVLKLVEEVEFNQQMIDVDIDKTIISITDAKPEILRGFDEVIAQLPKISFDDPLRDRIDRLFEGRIGPAPISQSVLDDISEEGRQRYQDEMPPGYKDSDKSTRHIHRGLYIESAYGDLLLWKQIIDFAKTSNTNSVIFVTDDQKEDWWIHSSGKTLGPRPELSEEIFIKGGVNNFWMYRSKNFVSYARDYIGAEFSENSLKDIASISDGLESSKKPVGSNFSDPNAPPYYLDAMAWVSLGADQIISRSTDSVIFKKSEQLVLAKRIYISAVGDDYSVAEEILRNIASHDLSLFNRAVFVCEVGMSETYGSWAHACARYASNYISDSNRRKIDIVFGRWITMMATFSPLLRVRNLETVERP